MTADTMKKTVCLLIIMLLIPLAGCREQPSAELEQSSPAAVAASGLISADAKTVTVLYKHYEGNATQPELKEYTAYQGLA